MAKRRGTLFTRAVRDSNSDGSGKLHSHAIEHCRVLGAGKVVLVHGRVFNRSGNGRLSFTAMESSVAGTPPREDGFPLALTGTYLNITSTGAFRFAVAGDFMTLMEIVAKVDSASGPSTETVEFSVETTVIEA
jgi:hypothetical protein